MPLLSGSYQPLTHRINADATIEERIDHLIRYYKNFLSVHPDLGGDDLELIKKFEKLKQEYRRSS